MIRSIVAQKKKILYYHVNHARQASVRLYGKTNSKSVPENPVSLNPTLFRSSVFRKYLSALIAWKKILSVYIL